MDVSLTLRLYVRDPAPGTPLEGWGDQGFLPISHLKWWIRNTIEVEDTKKANLRSPPANQLSAWSLLGSSSSSSSLAWCLAGGSGWVVSRRVAILGPLEPLEPMHV